MTDPNAQELAKLHDIHLPGSISWWPLAPGWYLLATLLTLAVMAIMFFVIRSHLNGRARRQALRLLSVFQQQYQREANTQLSAARISELLKRVALVYFSREQVASLQGKLWIEFLNSTAKNLDFNRVRMELIETPYQSTMDCDLDLLFTLARAWISQRRGPHV